MDEATSRRTSSAGSSASAIGCGPSRGPTSERGPQLEELLPTGPSGVVHPLPAGFDPDGPLVVGDALWIPSEASGQVFRFDLDALR